MYISLLPMPPGLALEELVLEWLQPPGRPRKITTARMRGQEL